jgi:cytochrome c
MTRTIAGLTISAATGAAAFAGSGAGPELSGVAAWGRDLYQARCSNCHSNEPGQSSLAPTLAGLMGRKAGAVGGFPYSEKIRALDLVWSAETLDVWLASQSLDSPLLRMRHLGVESPADRQSLAAYIATLK